MTLSMNAPVLIVGAGPVGLALAGDLAWRGVPSTIVERSDGTIEQPRMDMVGIRSMEHARRWGLVDDVVDSPYPRDYPQDNVYVTSLTGWELGRERFPSMGEDRPPPASPQKRERCPQDMFDPILRRWVERQGRTELRLRCELVGLRPANDHVGVDVLDHISGRREELRARYVVGCDGAASRVRELLGIEMLGTPVLTNTTNVIFRDPDLVLRHDKGRAYRFIVIGTEGTWATIVAINGNDRWRMSIVRSPRGGMSREEIGDAIRRAVGRDFPFEILSVTNWTRRELVAERYHAGRVFIAGDAAHVMSPTGGFGMNTGIGDAVDLSWKLEALLAGWGGPALPDSYTTERRPIAERNVREASGNLERMLSPGDNPDLCDDSAEGAAARARVGAEFADAMRREWYTLGIHLGYRYDSPIVVPDGTPAPPLETATYTPTARPGSRAPHAWLADGRSTLDLFGRGFTLLALCAAEASTGAAFREAAAETGVPLEVVALAEPEVRELYGAPYVLVRPDGHVAWRGEGVESARTILDRVRGSAVAAPHR
jgi:2-polyprenyl-6-methoxyphenol hydroxylase-like FAD-dependent oxidoreductase